MPPPRQNCRRSSLNFRVAEEFPRPGVLARNLDHRRVNLNRDDVFGGVRRLNRRIAQPHRRIEHLSARSRRLNLVERIVVRVDILDAVHRKPGDQQRRCAGGWHERTVAVGGLGECLNLADRAVFEREAARFAVNDFGGVLPTQRFALGKGQTRLAERDFNRRQAEIGRNRRMGERITRVKAPLLNQRLDLVRGEDNHDVSTRAFSFAQ